MESITIKVEKNLAKHIDDAMKDLYSTKTEFIREAIRDKIMMIKKEKAFFEINRHFGASKTKTSTKEEREIREKAGKQIAAEFGVKLD